MRTVITYGTFDLFHYGHMELLKRARKLGDRLIVGLSTDEFNLTEKNKISVHSYNIRKENVESLRFVDKVIPEYKWDQKIWDVKHLNVNVFVIGDDWKGKFDFLKEYCEVIYLSRTPDISSTLLKELNLKIV
jgi:glycerol-3-phosphate cytidylyltransferase